VKTFRDCANREWAVALNVAAVKRVRDLCNVDLMAVVSDEGKTLGALIDDPVLLADVIFAICRPQAQEKNITDEDFGTTLAGDPIDHATQALLEELADFFPGKRRALLRKVVAKINRYMSESARISEERLDDPELDRQLTELIHGGSSTSAPESSG